MGVVRTNRGEDGRPYVNIEDLIKEVELVKNNDYVRENCGSIQNNFIDLVLTSLKKIEEEYYIKCIFK